MADEALHEVQKNSKNSDNSDSSEVTNLLVNPENSQNLDTNNVSEKAIDEFNIIFQKIAENIEEPSTIFYHNLREIYRSPKDTIMQLLRQLDMKVINTLRDQLFCIFADHFDDDTLIRNGFMLNEEDLKVHLKKRIKVIPASHDIYNLGLSIYEKQIVQKLASDILKPTYYKEYLSNTQIISTDSSIIIEKLQQVITINAEIKKENSELKKQIQNLEKKIEQNSKITIEMKQKLDEQIKKADNSPLYSKVTSSPPPPPATPKSTTAKESTTLESPLTPPTLTMQETVATEVPPPAQPSLEIQTKTTPVSPSSKSNHVGQQTTKPSTPLKNVSSNLSKEHNSNIEHQSNSRWQTVYGRKQAQKSNITGQTKPLTLFIGGFNPTFEIHQIKSIIENDFNIKVISIYSNNKNYYNQSVKVKINFSDKTKAFNPNTWCEGIIVKPFIFRRKNSEQQRNHIEFSSKPWSEQQHYRNIDQDGFYHQQNGRQDYNPSLDNHYTRQDYDSSFGYENIGYD